MYLDTLFAHPLSSYGPANPPWRRVLVIGREPDADERVGTNAGPYDLPAGDEGYGSSRMQSMVTVDIIDAGCALRCSRCKHRRRHGNFNEKAGMGYARAYDD